MIVHLGQQLEVPERVALCPECGGKLTVYVSEIVQTPTTLELAAGYQDGKTRGRPTMGASTWTVRTTH